MGMPGSETALEELICGVLGDLIQKGTFVKLADYSNVAETYLQNYMTTVGIYCVHYKGVVAI